MRIALVGPTHPFRGGISHYTTLLCRALRARHEVRFYALSRQYPKLLFPGKTQIDESEASIRVEHELCVDSVLPWTWYTTARRIARQRPDLLLFSWWHPFFAPSFGSVAHLARRLAGVPSVFLCHNVLPHERSWVDMLLLRYAFSAGSGFITHSAGDAADLQRIRPGAPVLQNPHPTYEFFAGAPPEPEAARERLGLAGKRVVLFFGFVREYKGLDYLLAAMRQLADRPDVHLLVVGEFYEDPRRYREALDGLRDRGQVTLVDRYVSNEEVAGYFAAADLLVAPYLSATQSGVVQIAYAFDLPVVATTVGGLPEVVRDGETGWLVPPADAAALALAIRTCLAADRAVLRAAIRRENEKYSWDRMVDTIEQLADRT